MLPFHGRRSTRCCTLTYRLPASVMELAGQYGTTGVGRRGAMVVSFPLPVDAHAVVASSVPAARPGAECAAFRPCHRLQRAGAGPCQGTAAALADPGQSS